MDEIDNECREALSATCLEGNQQVAMAWHAPIPPPFLKIIFDVFMLMPYMLRHSNWEKDIIDLFKTRVAQYKQFENNKWEDWVEDVFMSSYGNWSFAESVSEHKTLIFNCNLCCLYIFEMLQFLTYYVLD